VFVFNKSPGISFCSNEIITRKRELNVEDKPQEQIAWARDVGKADGTGHVL